MTMPKNSMPEIFIDDTTNFSNTHQVTKIAFSRSVFDSDDGSIEESQPCLSIAMSNKTLLNMYGFLKKNIDRLVEVGVFSEQEIQEAMDKITMSEN